MVPLDTSTQSAERSEHAVVGESAVAAPGRGRGWIPMVLALVVTLVLGGASVARAIEGPKVDALTDLQFGALGRHVDQRPR